MKINDYVVDKYIDKNKPESVKEMLIGHAQIARKTDEFSYFKNSIPYNYKREYINTTIYQLQNKHAILNENIKSIEILDKKPEPRHLSVITQLDTTNQYWKTMELFDIIDIGGDEYCQTSMSIYGISNEIFDEVEKMKKTPSRLKEFIDYLAEKGTYTVTVESCTE